MRALRHRSAVALAVGIGLLASACEEQGPVQMQQASVDVAAFELVSERVLAPTVTESTYRARCRADAGPYDDAVVFVSTQAAGVQLVDAVARCGSIARGSSTASVETIVLNRDPTRDFDPASLAWVTLAYGSHTLVVSELAPGNARRLRYEVEVTDSTGRSQGVAAGVTSRSASLAVVDGLVTATTQFNTVRNSDGFEVTVAAGTGFDPASLVWTLSRGARSEFALAVTRTLDGSGQPLGGVAIEQVGSAGAPERRSEQESGLATVAEEAGAFAWKFTRDGHLPVWREGAVASGQVIFVPSPWLTRRGEANATFSVLNGGEVAGGGLTVRFAGGAFPAAAAATLTPIDGQTLPALLPAGWSPLAAFWLELSVDPQAEGAVEMRLAERLAPGERAFLVRFDPATRRWLDTGAPIATSAELATSVLSQSGAYAAVVADVGPSAPAAPAPGTALAPTALPFPLPDGLAATGAVTPPVAAASTEPALVTAQGDVVVTHDGPLPSGLVLRADVDETYVLRDGSTRTAPSYETFFVAYQRPGDDDPHSLGARFPLRPQVALGPEELDEASISLEILPVTAFEGGFFDPNGGRIATAGVLVTAPAGAVDRPRAVELRRVDAARFADLLAPGAARVAFELAAELRAGARVGASFGPQEPDSFFVLTRFVQSGGRSGLEPRIRYESDEFGVLRSLEPTSGPRLPGVTGSGTYVLVRVDGPRALVEGVARDTTGQASSGLAVAITGEPWLTFSAADGRWQLVAPPGQAEVAVTDLRNGDRGTQLVVLADPAAVGAADVGTQPAGPRVVEVDPADGAGAVKPSSPIRVVFSERLAALSPGDLVLTGAAGVVVPATISSNLARTEATLLPSDPLAADTLHTLTLAATITDPAGLPLEGPRSFQFTTQSIAARGAGAELTSWEPGAQTAACEDVPGIDRADPSSVCVIGSQGSADPDVPVILVNDTTGTTATVRSRADGSFESFIDAAVDDFVSATFVNANGTRIRIPVQRQLFDDGSVALFEGGGILEAESDGGPVQILVQPGSIPNKTKFKVNPLPFAEVQALMQSSPPEGGQLLSAVSLTISGDVPTESPEVSLPVDDAQLQLQPGEDPATHAFALAGVTESEDGGKAYQVVDKLHYEDGKLVTRSFPFLGLVLLVGQAVVEEFATIVITSIFLGDEAITTTGIVGSCQLTQVTGACIGEGGVSGLALGGPVIRPLPGAVVVAQPFEPGAGLPAVNARPGRIPTGAFYSIADRDGRYVLALALSNDLFGKIGREQAYQLVATHPRFSVPVVDAVFFNDFTLFNPLADRVAAKDLLFRVSGGLGSVGEIAAAGRPRLSVGHDPTRPAPGEVAELRIFSSHRKSVPEIDVQIAEVSPLVAGDTVAESDITLSQVIDFPSVNARRQEWSIVAAKPAAVKLRITAAADGADPAVQDYPIHFGGAAPPVVDPVKAADPNDQRGPFVLRSWPPEDSQALAPGDALFVVFNEAVSKALEEDPTGITLSPVAGEPQIELDPTQRQATIRFPELAPATPYTLTLTNAIRDLAEPPNGLDQDPTTDGTDSFQLHFETTPVRTMPLAGINSGGGALLHGDRAYVLDRNGVGDGTLRVFDVSDPGFPSTAGTISLPGFPRDMALIPNYSFKRTASGAVETRDLLAVVGGDLGAGSDDDGNFNSGNAYLNVFDVTDAQPVRLGGALLSQSAASTPTKVAWSPPMLSWLLSSSDAQTIQLLNLQMFLIGRFASAADRAQFPEERFDGEDANDDGDFVDVDDGDQLPTPEREPVGIDGNVQNFIVDDTNQQILDYFFDAPRLQLALALAAGKELDVRGQPTAVDAPASYRTLVANGFFLAREEADVPLPGTRPKRVQVVYGVQTRDAAGLPLVADLAFVSLAPETSTTPALAVIDVTNPSTPHLLGQIELPVAFGIPQSITVRDDGQIVLASTNDLLLLDAAQLAQPQPEQGDHPALLGQIDGAGSGARAFGTEASGMNVVSLGGRSQIVQTAPQLSFVQFPNETAVVDPEQIAGDAALRDAKLAGMAGVDTLVPGRVHADAGAEDSLDPPNPAVHYHVLVRAPGSAGETIEVGLESLDVALEPIGRKGYHFAPAQALREDTVADLGEEKRGSCDAAVRPLRAFRLAEDPRDPFYDIYLSAPFALIVEELKPAELDSLRQSIEREILWSGYFLRAFLEPSLAGNDVLGPWASEVVEKRMRVRANALARSLPGEYIVGKNPPPPNGHAEAPGTMGTIAAHSGEMRTNTLDLAVKTRLLPIVFERFSGSQDLYEGPFGRGWDFEYNQRITELREDVFPAGNLLPIVDRGGNGDEIATAKDLLFHTGEARTVIYEFKSTGEQGPPPEYQADPLLVSLGWIADAAAFYLPTPGVFDALVRFKDGTFGRLTPDGMQYRYNADGKLEKIYHRYEDNALELQYNGKGELIRVAEAKPPERYIDVGYYRIGDDDEFRPNIDVETGNAYHDGKIARLIDFTDRDVVFHYDAAGLLESREGVDVQTARLGGETGRAETRYDWGQCTEGSSANNLVGVKTGAGNGASLFSVTSFDTGERDVARSGTGINGSVQIALNHASTASALAQSGGTTTTTEPAGSITAMDLDTRGQPKRVTLSGGSGGSSDYDYAAKADGRVTKLTEPAGNSVELIYDDANANLRSRGNLITIRRTAGALPGGDHEASYSYDPAYNQRSGVQTDFNGNGIDYTLTDGGRSVGGITYPNAGSEAFTFDSFGQTRTHTMPDGTELSYEYDQQTGYLTSEGRGTFSLGYQYSGNSGDRGHPTTITPARGGAALTSLTYDELDRLVASQAGAFFAELAYDKTGAVRATSQTADTGEQRIERSSYDARGFLEQSTLEDIEVDGGPASLDTVFTPDELGLPEQIQRPGGALEILDYDTLDQIVERSFGSMVTSIERDDNGNPKKVTTGALEIRYVYDAHDRLHQTITPSRTLTYEYFGNGELRRVVVEDASGVIQETDYEVDSLGRVTKITEQTDDAPAETTIVYSGNTTTITDAAQQTTILTRGADGWLSSSSNGAEAVSYVRDGHGNVEQMISQEGGATFTTDYGWDPLDHPLSRTFGGVTESYVARPDGRVETVTNGRGFDVAYDFTRLGEPSGRTTSEGVVLRTLYAAHRESSGVEDAAGLARAYGYDTSLRQTSTTYRDGGQATYAFTGNDALARPAAVTIPGGSIGPSYDAEGRLIGQTISFGGETREETLDYDGLDRIVSATYPGGSASYDYDLLGPLRSATYESAAGSKTIAHTIRADGRRTRVDYPSGVSVDEGRDVHGRLETVAAGSPVIDSTSYFAADLVGTRSYGGGAVQEENQYDSRKRLVVRRYTNSQATLLAEERLEYDDADNVVARQFVHRGGRTDFFAYDRDDRLERADLGARPRLDVAEGGAAIVGFSPAGAFSRPLFARTFGFDGQGLDLLETAVAIDPDALAPPFATSYGSPDGNLQITQVDYGSFGAFTRGQGDELGNTVRSLLFPRGVTSPAPPIGASLEYDGLTHLRVIDRDDGARVEYRYQHDGNAFERLVTCPGAASASCVASHSAFVNDEGRRIEEYAVGASEPVARFYYADDDFPIAADLPDGSGGLARHFLLVDSLGSVMAVANASGVVVERIAYDAFGQPSFEAPDSAAPTLSAVRTDTAGGLLIQFSERVVGHLATPGSGPGLTTGVNGVGARVRVLANGAAVQGTISFEESMSPFGSTFRFTPQSPLSGSLRLQLDAGAVADEWNNPNAQLQTVDFDFQPTPGSLLLQGAAPGTTASVARTRTATGSAVAFHGHFFDADAGLVYMRARFYDPSTGLFLQRDPVPYGDSVNPYAGLGHNPASVRDPDGTFVRRFLAKLAMRSPRLGGTLLRKYDDAASALAKLTTKRGKRLGARQVDDVTPTPPRPVPHRVVGGKERNLGTRLTAGRQAPPVGDVGRGLSVEEWVRASRAAGRPLRGLVIEVVDDDVISGMATRKANARGADWVQIGQRGHPDPDDLARWQGEYDYITIVGHGHGPSRTLGGHTADQMISKLKGANIRAKRFELDSCNTGGCDVGVGKVSDPDSFAGEFSKVNRPVDASPNYVGTTPDGVSRSLRDMRIDASGQEVGTPERTRVGWNIFTRGRPQ